MLPIADLTTVVRRPMGRSALPCLLAFAMVMLVGLGVTPQTADARGKIARQLGEFLAPFMSNVDDFVICINTFNCVIKMYFHRRCFFSRV